MVEAYPDDDLPINTREEQWRLWARVLENSSSFLEPGQPSFIWYEDWRPWGLMLALIAEY